jgi:hypothetical protein
LSDAEPTSAGSDGERDRGFFARIADMGSVAQASVPGFYAWAVTVAPVAWARGGSALARLVALAGVVALLIAIFFERTHRPRAARLVSVWGLVVASAVVWMLAPAATASRIDAARGISGMLGWGLFAYTSAAPTYRRATVRPVFEGSELRARAASPAGDRHYLVAAAIAAIGLQSASWYAHVDERALFVRLVTLGASIAIVSSTASIALARHKRGRAVAASLRRAAVIRALAAVAVAMLVGIGLMLLR